MTREEFLAEYPEPDLADYVEEASLSAVEAITKTLDEIGFGDAPFDLRQRKQLMEMICAELIWMDKEARKVAGVDG